MPRKAKENIDEVKEKAEKKATKTASKTAVKRATSKKSDSKTAVKKATSKKSDSKKAVTKKVTAQSKKDSKTTANKKTATTKSRVSKKVEDKENKSKVTKKVEGVSTSKRVAKKSTEKAPKSEEKVTVKKVAPSKEKNKSVSKAAAKTTTAKKATTKAPASKKVSTKKSTATKTAVKKTTTAKKAAAKKATTKKKSANESKVEILEYYDLPYRYNQTVVKVLAQTPNTLFVYWDISDSDKEQYIKQYGEYFFNNTKPVLVVHNITKNYSFEVDINDFANSWYIHVSDSNCDYNVELARRPINQYVEIKNDYLHISSSNDIVTQNDHILFDKLSHIVYFRNVKTNQTLAKDIANFSLLQKIGKFNIKEFYKKLYPDEVLDFDRLDLRNPSSGNPTSSFK